MEVKREILQTSTPAASRSFALPMSMNFFFGRPEVQVTTERVSSRREQLGHLNGSGIMERQREALETFPPATNRPYRALPMAMTLMFGQSEVADEGKYNPSPRKISSGENQANGGMELEVKEGSEDALEPSLVGIEKEDTLQMKGKNKDEVVVSCTQESQD